MLGQELDGVQEACWVHALTERHVIDRLQSRVKVHCECHQLFTFHHVLGCGAPQLTTCVTENKRHIITAAFSHFSVKCMQMIGFKKHYLAIWVVMLHTLVLNNHVALK